MYVPGRKSAPAARKNMFGQKLRSMRKERGISLRDFAARMEARGWEVSEDVWGRVEAGKRIISDVELVMALRVLGFKLSDLEK